MGDFLRLSLWLGFQVVFEKENCIVTYCIFFLWIVKFLKLHWRRQITELRKYYLVWLFSLTHIFLYFYISQIWKFCVYSLHQPMTIAMGLMNPTLESWNIYRNSNCSRKNHSIWAIKKKKKIWLAITNAEVIAGVSAMKNWLKLQLPSGPSSSLCRSCESSGGTCTIDCCDDFLNLLLHL